MSEGIILFTVSERNDLVTAGGIFSILRSGRLCHFRFDRAVFLDCRLE